MATSVILGEATAVGAQDGGDSCPRPSLAAGRRLPASLLDGPPGPGAGATHLSTASVPSAANPPTATASVAALRMSSDEVHVTAAGQLCARADLPARPRLPWHGPAEEPAPLQRGSTSAGPTRGATSGVPQTGQDEVSPAEAFLYSSTLPGWGQRRLGQRRWLAFVALELASWGYLWDRRRTGGELRTRYRDLAWFVARRGTPGQRVDADFDYYESLTQFHSSGGFDVDLFQGGIQPETDTTTFNGSVWALAAQIFLVPVDDVVPGPGSPEYRQAIQYYRERSIAPGFRWDWAGEIENEEEYRALIRRSDEALRRSTTLVGVILANHLLAGFDAFITARLRAAESETSFDLQAFPDPFGQWWLAGRVVP